MAGDRGLLPLVGDHSLIRETPEMFNVRDYHTGLNIKFYNVIKNPRGPGYRDIRFIRRYVPVPPIGEPDIHHEDEVTRLLTE